MDERTDDTPEGYPYPEEPSDSEETTSIVEQPEAPPPPPPARERVMSIDALRGFDMFWIIGGYGLVQSCARLFSDPIPDWLNTQMSHPDWEGFTAWDMIMPLFLFVVGAAMPFSLGRRIEEGATKVALYRKILTRTAILFVFGMAAQGLLEYDLSKLHIYSNTLQAIACGYLIASIVMLHLKVGWQVLIAAALLAGYWALMMFIPFPGHEAGTLEPKANLARHIDDYVFGRFVDGTTYTWLLSGMGFAATVLLGVFAGHLLRTNWRPSLKCLLLIAWGGVCLGLGWVWGCHPSPYRFPIIKHAWTSSMVLWAGGWSYLLLAIFYLTIDVIGFRRWAFPFVVIGANAIAVYMATHLFDFHQIGDVFVGNLAPHLDSYGLFVRELAAFAIIWMILLYLYRKKTFIRI